MLHMQGPRGLRHIGRLSDHATRLGCQESQVLLRTASTGHRSPVPSDRLQSQPASNLRFPRGSQTVGVRATPRSLRPGSRSSNTEKQAFHVRKLSWTEFRTLLKEQERLWIVFGTISLLVQKILQLWHSRAPDCLPLCLCRFLGM